MIYDQTTQRVPIYAWAEDIESGALQQAVHLSNLPMVSKHIALMPDVHQGYGMPIGGVLAADNAVIPNAVGVDIGCGMIACRTSLDTIPTDQLKALLGQIRQCVPVGFGHHKDPRAFELPQVGPVTAREATAATRQIGTLGGGNHFIEIQRETLGEGATRIWLMIHSGSRNVGLQVAKQYNDVAIALNARWRASVPKEWQLAFLPLDSEEAHAYLAEMQVCVDFARQNRAWMMIAVQECLRTIVPDVGFEESLDVPHNYARLEHHFGRNVVIHRKGATAARAGQLGIIPGSQGTASYIVRGLGHHDAFESCSHGAGRRMGRREAERTLDLAAEVKRMDDLGILHAVRGKGGLDEAPGAYKDIDTVMAQQADLVSIETRLTPMAVIKG